MKCLGWRRLPTALCPLRPSTSETLHPGFARRRHGLAPGALRPAGGHVRTRDEQGRLLRPGGVFHHRHPPTGWTNSRGRCARARSTSAACRSSTAPGRHREVLANAPARALLAPAAAAWSSSRATPTATSCCSCTRARPTLLRLRPPRRRRRLRHAAARHDVAARVRGAGGPAADRVDQCELHAARERPRRPPCNLRSGDARHATHRRGVPGAAVDAGEWQVEVKRRGAYRASRSRSIRSTRSAGTASSPRCG